MTAALDQEQRNGLERFVQRARRLLEEDLAREAEGRFGIHVADGEVEDEDGLHLDPAGLGARRDVVEILEFLRREEPSGAEAVARLIREASFTHFNRFVAVRIAEAIQLLPESLANGPASAGFKELLEVAPLLSHDDSGGYWRYLQLCGDELASDLPQLFDPRNPLLELAPSPAALDELVEMIAASDLDGAWDAPDTLGWAYQFFNSGDERRAMREASASPRTARELAVRNQFFTPRYVVDFLVHNSLGRRLLEADPNSSLVAHLPLLLDPPTKAGMPINLSEVRVLDPACGSGHFLLGAYDVLERAWELQGVPPEEAAPRIVSSLWGIDIDVRCAQVAAAALVFRARRHCKTYDLPIPNVITARALPEPTGGWLALLAELPEDRRQLVVSIRDALDDAPLLGSLLKVEELIAREIRFRVVGATDDESTLFGAMGTAGDTFARAETDVLAVLQQVADSATSSPSDRLFAAEARDALRFVEAMRQRYDVVLMNPPFGEPVAETRGYLSRAYPLGVRDLYAVFTSRGLQLCLTGGYLGAITSRAGLFLRTFEAWRSSLFIQHQLIAMVDLGRGVMHQALVEAAAYVVKHAIGDSTAVIASLLGDVNREAALLDLLGAADKGTSDPRLHRRNLADLAALPSKPIAYWFPEGLTQLFARSTSIEPAAGDVRMGLSSGDDFRFVRAFWEVRKDQIAFSSDQTASRRWAPFAKGGDYGLYWSDVHLLVDWAQDGQELSGFAGSAIRSRHLYFHPGLTYPPRTRSGFGVRVLPAGCVFGHKGPSIFPRIPMELLLAWLTSRPLRACVEAMVAAGDEATSGGASRSYEVGLVKDLPWPVELSALGDQLKPLVDGLIVEEARRVHRDETTRYYEGPTLLSSPTSPLSMRIEHALREYEDSVTRSLSLSFQIDSIIADSLELDPAAGAYVDSAAGPHPCAYPRTPEPDESKLLEFYSATTEDLVNLAAQERGRDVGFLLRKSYIADRRIELLSHAFQIHPATVLEARRAAGVVDAEFASSEVFTLFSWLVGVALGRWDAECVRRGTRGVAIADLLGEVPLEPPAACVQSRHDALSYLILDEPGHPRDLEKVIGEAARATVDEADVLVGEVVSALGAKSVRAYCRTGFFRQHLSCYTRSRRRAPIYWPLAVPSGLWGLWAYAPMLSREMLYAIAAEALRREGHAGAEIARLERERSSGGLGRDLRSLDTALDAERKLGEELRRFRHEAERIASLGWEPDLDDGVALCAAPLADLLPMWKEPAQYRKELREGEYQWSTVSKWADQL